ncbi:MAG: dockerin type I domain-containing protein [Candidatus Bathyarchaeia archaeon]
MGRLAGLFLVVMLLSASLSTLPLAFADYAVDHASFPPDLPGDVNYDGKVDAKDVGITSKAFGSYFYTDSWDPRADVNDDGMVDMKDIAPVSRLFGTAYDTSATPIAYSTSFEFNVPNDGDASVWYYFLVRFYVPSSLDGRTFSLVAGKSVDDALRNVRVDTVLKQSGQVGELFNINLGEMQKGYHLLELEYLESIGSGLINFTIKTAQDEYAQMDRFRIYVPNYGDTEVKYTVKTTTYFPGDTFFLGSSASQHLYVDDYIDDVYIDAGLLWQDWMWNMGSYDTLHAWKDGFLYPLGWQTGWHTIKFAYGEKLEYGLLDFQFISWTNQRDKIGKPKLYAVGNLNPANYITIKDGKFMAGSKWKFEADPEFSERYFDGRLRFNASYDDGTVWFNTTIEIGLGKGWAE